MTPENVFGELAASIGFASREAAEKAIVMFARIKECAWARAMLATMSAERMFLRASLRSMSSPGV